MEYTRHRWLPLVPRNHRNHRPHVLRLSLSHSLLEPFSQVSPLTTRPPPTAEETYTTQLLHPRHHSPTTQLPAGTNQDVPGNEQRPPPHARLWAHAPHEAALPAVHRDAVHSLWASYEWVDTFRGYWLHRDALGMFHDGRIVLNDQISRDVLHSLWASCEWVDTFRGYWLHRDALGKIHDGRIVLSDQISRDAVHSLWASYEWVDTFRGYWLHRDALGKFHDGRIVLSDQISRDVLHSLWASYEWVDTFRGYWLHRDALGKFHDGRTVLSDQI
jgi:hypothetical protein